MFKMNSKIKKFGSLKRKKIQLLLLMLIFFAFVFAFSYVPLFGWIMAFQNFRPGIPFLSQEFIGLRNFELIFMMWNDFSMVLKNTLALSGLTLLVTPIPLLFAILLAHLPSKRLSKITQVIAALPNYISFVLLYAVFFAVLAPSDGLLNVILRVFLGPEVATNFLADSDLAWIMQTIVHLFKTMGFSAIIYIAAMTGIDPSLYEAAEVDGAGKIAKIIHITLPGVSSTFFVLFLLGIANMLSGAGFEQYFVFQNPMTLGRLEVIDTFIYKMGILQNNFGFATAAGMMKSLVSIVLLLIANNLSKAVRGERIF